MGGEKITDCVHEDGWRGAVPATPAAEGPHWGMGVARMDGDTSQQDPSAYSVGNFVSIHLLFVSFLHKISYLYMGKSSRER